MSRPPASWSERTRTGLPGPAGGAADTPDKSPARIAGMFDSIARRYDLLNHLLSGGLDLYWRWRAIRALRLGPEDVLVDVCAGTADVMLAALRRRRARPRYVVGVDFAHQMLRIGQRKLGEAGVRPCSALVRGDAMALPVASAQAAAATVAFGIRNVIEPATALAEIHRVLRPGGRLAVLEFSMPRARWVRTVYTWYFTRVLPRVGALVSRHADAYSYLPASVGSFPHPERFRALLLQAGFARVDVMPLTLGIVQLYVAEKDRRGD